MILAELSGGVAQRFERLGNGDVALLQANGGAWNADLGETGAQTGLAGDERRSTGGATILRIVVGEQHAFLGDAINIGSLIPHQPVCIGADVRLPDIVTEDDEDVWLLPRRCLLSDRGLNRSHATGSRQNGA